MVSVTDALTLTQQHLLTLPTETVSIDEANGRVLREAVLADRNFPPFDRVAMDGICIRFADYQDGPRKDGPRTVGTRTFQITGAQFAGKPQQTLSGENACLEVMTGSMLPQGADTVIRYEDVTIADGRATITIEGVEKGQHLHFRATDRRSGDILLPIGTRLGPAELAVAASVGQAKLVVTVMPRVALISTGDELVDVTDAPLPYQIRRSNTYMLRANLASLGINATLHHIVDDEATMVDNLRKLLDMNDVLILSGGVSAGKADFVPGVLVKLGVQQQFHQIKQRPGKPLWFGTTSDKAVFGLPGNPVSTVLCAYRYVLPYLKGCLGLPTTSNLYAQLAQDITFQPPVTYFLPVRLTSEPDGRTLAHPLPGSGSADFANLLDADAFMELPPNQSTFNAGQAFPLWSTRG
jgi:molybdopterin molybdotransferase